MRRMIVAIVMSALFLVGSSLAGAVSIIHWNWNETDTWLQDMAREFEEQTGIKIDIQIHPGPDMHEKLVTALAGNVEPDVVMYHSGYGLLSIRDVVADLRPFMERDSNFNAHAFIPAGFPALTIPAGLPDAGKVVGIPWAVWTQTFGYNQTVWEKAGAPEPSQTWTWDDFKELARKFTSDTDGDGEADVHGAVVIPISSRIGGILHNAGTFWYDRPLLPLRSNTTDSRVIQVLEDLQELYAAGVLTSDGATYGISGSTAIYGAAAPNVLNQRSQGLIHKFMRNPVWPGGKSGTELGILSYSILESSAHKQEAWEWIKFLTENDANQLSLIDDARFGRMPANLVAVQEYIERKAEIEPTIFNFMAEVNSPDSYPRPEHPDTPQINSILDKLLAQTLTNREISVSEAMIQADQQIEPMLAKYR